MRTLVIADIHANLTALDAVLAAAGSVDAVWHCGDIVGYGPDPDDVVERLRGVGAIGVRGNHDEGVLADEHLDSFNPEARKAIEWTRTVMKPATRDYIEALPLRLEPDGVTIVHGSPRDPIWEYIFTESVAASGFRGFETPICLHGHTHVPVVYRLEPSAGGEQDEHLRTTPGRDGLRVELTGARFLLNPGSVGQPRDRDPRASFLVLDTGDGSATWHRVPYDTAAVQARMQKAGLPAWLIERLSYGQ